MARAWLDVPYQEKDEAKAHGARWDPKAKRWYAPQAGMAGLDRWAPRPEVPDLLPGEDRSFGSGLFVDLIPQSCWFTNVRSCVSAQDWERLRRMINGRAGQRCEACGRGEDREAQRWLEAHERWDYDAAAGVQRLRRLVCLCTDCHTVTHFGLAEVKGKRAVALAHLRSVTGMSLQQAEAHVRAAFEVWCERSARMWMLDLNLLTDAGIGVVRPPAPAERQESALRTAERERSSVAQAGPPTSTPPQPAAGVTAVELPWEKVSNAQLSEGLNAVFSRPAAGGGVQWVAVPQWPWFCHMCDTHMRPPDISVASVERDRPGRPRIICKPCEWAHLVDEVQLPRAVHRAVIAAAGRALSTPGSAATWDVQAGQFRVVTGQLIDWRQERDQRDR